MLIRANRSRTVKLRKDHLTSEERELLICVSTARTRNQGGAEKQKPATTLSVSEENTA